MEIREYIRDEILEEADHGFISEPEMLRRMAIFDRVESTESLGLEAVLMTATNPSPMSEASVPADDESIIVESHSVERDSYTLDCYVARPSDSKAAPGILVIHENRGLTEHIRDVARRIAKHGYVALAPDLLSPKGGADCFSDPAEQIAAIGSLQPEDMIADLLAAVNQLATSPGVESENLGVLGFCFGGGMAWRVAALDPRIHAAVPFYGPNPPIEAVPAINGPVLGIYGALDERINAGIPDIEAAMATNKKIFEKEIYEGAGHAFHNDTNADRYNDEAAHRAWARAIEWFDRHLRNKG
jgi:carboxymethylenebutenolidase